ncbi:uncharacterized protein EI90DRAFT_2696629 [Cantharellus anzutake]|uniref:uncharacterized protein n=1 Tax=Cantharellus anzutake TaxID=1750568 RepID=UPI0019068C79|nr:uncharacterized protein EI90DRAFT_2696629 [Cantharellus anzutake]KAF8318819.1 hypothetical protein EI90DRAFT_2696629 [Cantharellus anzutake]
MKLSSRSSNYHRINIQSFMLWDRNHMWMQSLGASKVGAAQQPFLVVKFWDLCNGVCFSYHISVVSRVVLAVLLYRNSPTFQFRMIPYIYEFGGSLYSFSFFGSFLSVCNLSLFFARLCLHLALPATFPFFTSGYSILYLNPRSLNVHRAKALWDRIIP